jgi:hypothetical protein
MIDEAHDGLDALGHHECWSRHEAIIAHQIGRGKIGVNLICGRFDIDLIVFNGLPCLIIGKDPVHLSTRNTSHSSQGAMVTYVFGVFTGAIGSATLKKFLYSGLCHPADTLPAMPRAKTPSQAFRGINRSDLMSSLCNNDT